MIALEAGRNDADGLSVVDPVDIRHRLGRNVRRRPEEQAWSQEDYADCAGIHRTYVIDI